ncbi:MAG: DUF4442 domain-containing protein [Planctomycetota bacterium]|nr:DUF4442 domain-containing protein [Planctomycetota bacterium]
MIDEQTPASRMRWWMNLWPPFLFQGIRITEIDSEFQFAVVRVRKTILTRNLMGSTFGGALFSAADPFFPILYWRYLALQGIPSTCWSRSIRGEFVQPASRSVELRFAIDTDQLEHACREMKSHRRVDLEDVVEARLPDGALAARFHVTSALRGKERGSAPLPRSNSLD